jgi:hypothetical protein
MRVQLDSEILVRNDAPPASTPSKWKLLFKETPDDGLACLEWADLSLYQSIHR